MMPEDYCDDDYGINPYESFMRKHLQHYGYYTGKNQNYKNQFQQYAEWEKNYAYNLSSSSSEESDSDSDDEDKNGDSKLQEELRRTTQIIYSCGESGKMIPRLREPRSLYALNKELGPQQAARWPSDIQVVNERIRHIQTLPPEPEPFYKQTGMEKCPMVRGEANGGRVVFRYETNSSFFMKSRVGGSRNGCDLCAVSLESENDTTLIFESRFESGNLGKVVQIGESEYELWLRYDLYTNKHTQWFYFRVSNTRANKEYRFTIVNFMKPDSLYNDGMRPVMYSEKDAALNKVGWVRGGQDIKYYKNNMRYEMGRADRYYYSMTWTAKMKHDHDTVYFSHCYPYTYTDLQDYLLEVSNDPIKSRICKQRVLCRTLAGNLIYVLTITSASQNPEDMKHKKAVVVTSRVHPGESNASWMMKGFLDFITSSSPDAKLLRDTFIFKVVPMLNPDGVIVGNYRCSLAGRDLNRNYKTSLKDAYPSVWHTKNMIRKLLLERDIIVYCDLHGHSRRQNVFIYGCEQRHGSNKRFHEKVFPSMLNKNTPEKFSFKACKFKVQKSKEGTGRVVMWNMGIMNSYTLEATFCGSSLGKKKGFHFNQRDFEMMGYHFCDTLLDYCDPDNTKYTKIMVELEDKHQMEVMTKMAEKGLQGQNVEVVSDISTDTESSDGGSDSSVSDGPPVHLQYAAARPKKKKLKSKKDRDKVRVGKEDLKRLLPQQEERRMRNNQVKPLKQDPSKGQPIRYTSNSPKRLMDERSNSGIPVFVQERFDEKQQKRHDYLEALTAAYISNNIPITNDPGDTDTDLSTADGARHLEEDAFGGREDMRPPSKKEQGTLDARADGHFWREQSDVSADSEKVQASIVNNPVRLPRLAIASGNDWSSTRAFGCSEVVHFRYSGTTYERPPNPQPLEGLCAHHEQTLAAQLAAAQAQSGASHHTGQFQAALRDLELRRLTPKWLQEAAVKMIPLCDVRRGDSAFKICRLVGRRERLPPDAPNMEDLLRHHLNHPASITPLDRRHKPHLLEVSAAQQRQTDALSRDKNSSIKTHPNPFDEKAESARRGSDTDRSSIHTKSHVPSATNYVNYNTFKVTSIKEEPDSQNGSQTLNSGTQKTGHKDKDRSGRKSRKGMREEDETDEQELGSVVSGHEFDARGKLASRPPKVKSAESSENMASALSSIQEIQKSLEEPTQGQGQNQEQGVAGEYIQKLIKETNDEIQELTHEIQEDIEKKQQQSSRLLFRKMPSRHNREQGSHREGSEIRGGAGGQQKMKLNMGYHGATFVNDLGPAKASEDRYGGGYLAGRSAGVGGSAGLSQGGNGRTSNEPRPDVPLSYSGASMPTVDPAKLPGGPNLMVASTRQRQTPIEEEAHTRSLKRQTNLTPSLMKTEATIYTVDNRSLPTAEREPASSSGHMNSLTPSLEEQDSNSHHRHGNSAHLQQPPVRLNRQNLVFRSAADGSRVTTPRGPSQQSEHLGDQGESLESRARSARCSSRQVVETVPTKISLMICSDHPESSPTPTGGHFQPLSRQGVRPPIFRQQGRKK